MQKILTIIIPTYNAEQFLDKGLPTFIMDNEHRMEQLEVLIVNDGTPDNSVEVAQKYVDQYPNTFSIINKENGGHGSAINVGVEHATGKYFKVVDADDWVDTEVLLDLLHILETEEFEAMLSSYVTYDISKDEYETRAIKVKNTGRLYNMGELMDMWEDAYHGFFFHGVLYNTEFYKKQNYKLEEKVFYEDQEFATIPLARASRIRLYKKALYIYRIGDVNQSVSVQSQLNRLDHFEKVLWKMLDFEPQTDMLPAGGKAYWMRKVSKFVADVYLICLVKNENKKEKRTYIKELNNRIAAKSPAIASIVKRKYLVFCILNRLHMKEDTFSNILRWGKRVLHVDRLYND